MLTIGTFLRENAGRTVLDDEDKIWKTAELLIADLEANDPDVLDEPMYAWGDVGVADVRFDRLVELGPNAILVVIREVGQHRIRNARNHRAAVAKYLQPTWAAREADERAKENQS